VSDPFVKPSVSTIYTVVVSDGFNTASSSVGVTVNAKPVVTLGNDTVICVFDTITIDAGNEGSNYIWSNGSTARTISIGSTGIGFESRTLSVSVTSPDGCMTTGQLIVTFDFIACTGIGDHYPESGLRIYPNPGNGMLYIETTGQIAACYLSIIDWQGRIIEKNKKVLFSGPNSQFVLDITSYPEGIYLLRIEETEISPITVKYILSK